MTTVVIQPAYGNPIGVRNARKTLHIDVPFGDERHAAVLSPDDLRRLSQMHLGGKARFWGATRVHDLKMERVSTGDVVLFAGQKKIRAVGEVGLTFRNPTFADLLWDPDPANGSWHNLYSLMSFEFTDIPYQEVHDLPGLARGNLFRSLGILDPVDSDTVIDGLSITTLTARREADKREIAAAEALARRSREVEPEGVHTTETYYEPRPGGILVHRTEAVLLEDYRSTLEGELKRVRTPVGVTDLQVRTDEGYEIVEAKSDHGPEKVRQAVAQLLHYVPYCPRPVTRLTALFPARPSDLDLAYLHRLGMDCVHLGEPGYRRLPAPGHRRQAMQSAWVHTED